MANAPTMTVSPTADGDTMMVRFDPSVDARVGELLCRALRNFPDTVLRAAHRTAYDGFYMLVTVRDTRNDVHGLVRHAADVAAAEWSALLHETRRVLSMLA